MDRVRAYRASAAVCIILPIIGIFKIDRSKKSRKGLDCFFINLDFSPIINSFFSIPKTTTSSNSNIFFDNKTSSFKYVFFET